MRITFSAKSGHEFCDFCSSSKIYKDYPCKDFTIKMERGIPLNSSGEWASCKICADLIDAEQWDKMLMRGVETFIAAHPDFSSQRDWVWEFVKELQKGFRANRLPIH